MQTLSIISGLKGIPPNDEDLRAIKELVAILTKPKTEEDMKNPIQGEMLVPKQIEKEK